MKPSEILVKPILTEKANAQQEKLRKYAFKVDRKANKLEIKKAVEDFQKGILGSIPAIYKEDAKKPLHRTNKLSGDILDVHNAPTDLQEG